MESLAGWASKEGSSIEPYGLELIPPVAALARGRLPEWSGRISIGSVMSWRPPFRFEFVRAELEYVTEHRRPSMVRCLLDEYLAPGGRLILCSYGSYRRPEPKTEPVAKILRDWNYGVAGESEAVDTNGVVITRAAWIGRDAGRPRTRRAAR